MEWILFLRCLILFAISPAWFSRDKRNRQCTQWSLHGTLVQKYTEEIWFKNAKRKTFNSHLKNLLKDKNIFQPPSCWKKKKKKRASAKAHHSVFVLLYFRKTDPSSSFQKMWAPISKKGLGPQFLGRRRLSGWAELTARSWWFCFAPCASPAGLGDQDWSLHWILP